MALGAVGYVVAAYYFVYFIIFDVGAQLHPNAAESEPHGLDGLGELLSFIAAAVSFTVASAFFTPGIILYLISKKPQQPTKQ